MYLKPAAPALHALAMFLLQCTRCKAKGPTKLWYFLPSLPFLLFCTVFYIYFSMCQNDVKYACRLSHVYILTDLIKWKRQLLAQKYSPSVEALLLCRSTYTNLTQLLDCYTVLDWWHHDCLCGVCNVVSNCLSSPFLWSVGLNIGWIASVAMNWELTWSIGISTVFRGHWQSPCTDLTAGH